MCPPGSNRVKANCRAKSICCHFVQYVLCLCSMVLVPKTLRYKSFIQAVQIDLCSPEDGDSVLFPLWIALDVSGNTICKDQRAGPNLDKKSVR